MRVNDELVAETASEKDVEQLVASIRVIPCNRCSSPAFDPTAVSTNREGLCESCFISDLQTELDRELEADRRQVAKRDRQMKARGMTVCVTAWIHPEAGDDYQIDWYEAKKPSTKRIQSRLRDQGSEVLNDYQLIVL